MNRQYTQQLMTYDDEGNLKDAYVYGNNDERLTRDYIQNDNPTESGHRALDTYLYDGRGSVTQVTNEQSNIVGNQQYRYDPFGNMIQNKPDNEIMFGYNGEEYNPITNTQYLRARYYDVGMSRFISKDTDLGDTQNPSTRNLYAYTANDPVNHKDPSGNRVWLIHGTWSDATTWTKRAWSVGFLAYLKGKIFKKEEVTTFGWSGKNKDSARRSGAITLENKIREWHKKHPKDPIRLVAHSHGGNVAILTVNNLMVKKAPKSGGKKESIKASTLITIATPIREYRLKTKVGQHLNVYNYFDAVQISGTWHFEDNPNGDGIWMFGRRTYPSAENIKIPIQGNPDVKVTRIDYSNVNWGGSPKKFKDYPNSIEAHSVMHSNIKVWAKYITPRLKLKKTY